MKNKIAALVLFLGFFGVYLRHVSPSVTAGDSGEFMTAARTLSLPHAPSFPLYTVVSHCFVRGVPWAAFPYRCNAFSALTSALCVTMVFWIFLNVGLSLESGWLASALLGFSASFWENSLVTEVFSLNALWMALLVWCLLKARTEGVRFVALFFFLLGLGLGNHHVLIFMFPAFFVFWWMHPQRREVVSNIGKFAALGALGFSIYLFLPVRSFREPPLNWGRPTTVSRFVRTILRKDYGSLKLAPGETPERTLANAGRHLKNFFRHLDAEVSWPVILLGLAGFAWGAKKKDAPTLMAFSIFIASGPFFMLLGNLPFSAQSDGIIGRFYIMPAMALLLGAAFVLRHKKWVALPIIVIGLTLCLEKGWATATAHRQGTLVLDYGRAMLRTMTPGSILYMDGGDDAFYSLAMLHYGLGQRPDVELHDRGGLVYKNPYGDDFRSLAKDQKKERRAQVEAAQLSRRDIFYSTMDSDVLPAAKISQAGFLLKAETAAAGAGMPWNALILRSLYPLRPNDYRTRSLGAFFPFMRGKLFLKEQKVDEALRWFHRAAVMGGDVDWLNVNLNAEYAALAYKQLMDANFPLAEKAYRQWMEFDPNDVQAQSNLGVVLEKSGRIAEARAQYQLAADHFPQAADPVFNMAVLSWKESDWPRVVAYLEEVVRRKPEHAQARGYLRVALEKMGQRK